MWPKREDEHVEEFRYCDDDELAILRRKLLRFANDQAKAISEIKPTFPTGFNNSVAASAQFTILTNLVLSAPTFPGGGSVQLHFVAPKKIDFFVLIFGEQVMKQLLTFFAKRVDMPLKFDPQFSILLRNFR